MSDLEIFYNYDVLKYYMFIIGTSVVLMASQLIPYFIQLIYEIGSNEDIPNSTGKNSERFSFPDISEQIRLGWFFG